MKIKIFVILLLLVFSALVLSAALRTSGTCDEIAHHIPVGYVLLTKWDFKMDTSQPPLARYIIAVPLKLFMHINMPEDKNKWRIEDRSIFGRDFFYKYNTDSKKILFLCRIPVMIIGALCGLLLFVWVASLYGERAGLLSLFLYCFSPSILAHSGLATTDIIATFFIFLSVYSFWLFLNKSSFTRSFFTAACLGLAQLAKYNAILLYPIFLVLMVFESQKTGKSKITGILTKFIIAVVLSLVVVWAGYGFDFQPILKDAMRVNDKVEMARKIMPFLSDAKLHDILFRIPIPLGSHILGISGVFRHSYEGHRTFFLGKWSGEGNIFYFLVAFMIKNPIPMLILFIIGFFIVIKKGVGRAERVVLITLAAYFIASSLGKLQIGIRHILPLYPLCFMIAGRTAELLNRKFLNLAVAILIAWHIFLTLIAWPNYIGYFNEIIGGSRNGYKYLRDSNIDWGQDLPALSDYMKKNNINEVVLEYFGQSDPAVYGIRYKKLQPEELVKPKDKTYAISAQNLESARWARDYKQTAIVGSSIFIYDLTKKNYK